MERPHNDPFILHFISCRRTDRTFSAFHPGQYCQSFREHQRTLGIHLPQGLCKAFLIQLMNHRHCIQVGWMTVHYNFVVCIICEPCTMTQYMGGKLAGWSSSSLIKSPQNIISVFLELNDSQIPFILFLHCAKACSGFCDNKCLSL